MGAKSSYQKLNDQMQENCKQCLNLRTWATTAALCLFMVPISALLRYSNKI